MQIAKKCLSEQPAENIMNRYKNIILCIACSAVFLEALDIAIMNLALPLIQQYFRLPTESIQWLQTIYVLLYGGFLIIGGKLTDTWGKKTVFLTGATLFLITSIGAGFSTSFNSLLAFRAIQGLGAALLMPSAMAIITNTFPKPTERGKALGIFSSFAAIGSGCGLSLGGIIASYLGWQWIFFINVPIIASCLVFAFIFIPADAKDKKVQKPDIISGFILSACIIAISYFIHALPHLVNRPLQVLALLTSCSVGIICFIKRAYKHPTPLINFQLLKGSYTKMGNQMIFIIGLFFLTYLLILSFYLQDILHFSAAKAGLLLFPFSVGSAMVSKFLLPSLLKKLAVVKTAIIGMLLMFFGALFLVIGIGYGLFTFVIFSVACVMGAGMAVSIPSLTVMALQQIPVNYHGTASGVNTTAYFFGSGMGLSILSLLMQLPSVLPTLTYQLLAALFILLSFTILAIVYLLVKNDRIKKLHTVHQ
ncbi:MAG TPA: MFS transporter [Pseudosphingobacterium sp.]|nr:MFS transporter [Pseudosphingobacterium sp.]